MIEKIFDRSRLWKEFMIEKLGLSASFAQSGFAEIIVESGIDGDDFCIFACSQARKSEVMFLRKSIFCIR